MPAPRETVFRINRVISHMVEVGLADDQNLAFQRDLGGSRSEVTFAGAEYQSFGLKDWGYNDIYDALKRERAYTVLLQDGALLQFSYQFLDSYLEKNRLAFWPSPHLERF